MSGDDAGLVEMLKNEPRLFQVETRQSSKNHAVVRGCFKSQSKSKIMQAA
jgi:hypothetical protein